MSATRDKTQKTVFVYSNLYQIYRKELDQAMARQGVMASSAQENPANRSLPDEAAYELPSARPQVLRADDLRALGARVEPYRPPELLRKRFRGAPDLPASSTATPSAASPFVAGDAIESLRRNLRELHELHSKLRFMLQELEEYVKR